MKLVLPLVAGAAIGTFYDRWARGRPDPELALRMGTLTATGLIVGESLWGVAFALIVYLSGSDAPLALPGSESQGPALLAGLALFAGATAALYRTARRSA